MTPETWVIISLIVAIYMTDVLITGIVAVALIWQEWCRKPCRCEASR